jgi:hypothetical protein
MADHLPVEFLRLGGMPAHPLPEPGPDIEWDPFDQDGEPKISNIGGALAWSPSLVNICKCPKCPAELVTPQFLKLHLAEKHGE